jgi:hypothetical protein
MSGVRACSMQYILERLRIFTAHTISNITSISGVQMHEYVWYMFHWRSPAYPTTHTLNNTTSVCGIMPTPIVWLLNVMYEDDAVALAGTRLYQSAQASLSRWFKRSTPRWANGKQFKALSDEDKIKAAQNMVKSQFYKRMPNLEKRRELAKYCQLISTIGVTKRGAYKPGGATHIGGAKGPQARDTTMTAVTIQGTYYPHHSNWDMKYGPARYATMELIANSIKAEAEYQAIKQHAQDWVAELRGRQADLHWLATTELCPQNWLAGNVKLHVHLQLRSEARVTFFHISFLHKFQHDLIQ